MAMGMKPSLNILMSFGPMILILQLGHFCACFVALKRLEKEPIRESRVLFKFELQNTFFQQIM
jgi:hypothetical protein